MGTEYINQYANDIYRKGFLHSGHCEEDIEKVLSEFTGVIKDHEYQIPNSKRELLIENTFVVGCVTRIGSSLEEKIIL